MILFSCACYFYKPPLEDAEEKVDETTLINTNKNNNKEDELTDEKESSNGNVNVSYDDGETVF